MGEVVTASVPTRAGPTPAEAVATLAQREEHRRQRAAQHVERLRRELPELARGLAERFSVGRVWLFGSLAWGHPGAGADIDLAVEDLAASDYFGALASLMERASCRVDLVRIEDAAESLRERILADGKVLVDRR